MMKLICRCHVVLLTLVLAPALAGVAHAQTTVSDIVGFLVTNQAIKTDDLARDQAAAEAARDTISRALLVNLTSAPLATSSSGFLYRLNPQLGTVERATESFGPFFVERALTPGRGRASFGMSGTSAAFDELDGRNLRDGTLVTVARQFRDEPAAFDTESLTLKIRSSTMTIFGSVGVTSKLEIGAAVPFARVAIEGNRVNVYRGTTFLQASGTGTASGISDIAVRAKYTLLARQNGGVAAATEVRLPTGDAQNLLGTGKTSYRFIGIGSLEQGAFALHGNASFLRGGISPEWSAAGAASYAVSPRVTLSGELLRRHVSDLHDVSLVALPHPTIEGLDILRLTPGVSPITLASAVAGLKWNVTGTLVLGGHVSFALAKRGLTAPLTPTVALEYAF
jgi:outer membrane putative beta-barrel porin/alpha-amylase